jgi:hypothetical protein
MDGRLAYDELRYDFEGKINEKLTMERNTSPWPEELNRLVDEKIKSIVVKWQPQKESEKP